MAFKKQRFNHYAMPDQCLCSECSKAILMNTTNQETSDTYDCSQYILKGLSAAVIEAYNMLPNLDLLIPSVMTKGVEFSSATLSMVPGIPIKPMLAKITNGVPQVLKLFHGKALTCEFKYDGQRAQIHKLYDGSIRVFSRNRDDTTSRFPDVISIINDVCKSDTMTFIIDVDVVAVDRKSGPKLLSFQELSYRDRGGKNSVITVDVQALDTNWMGIGSWLVYESNTLTSHRVALHHRNQHFSLINRWTKSLLKEGLAFECHKMKYWKKSSSTSAGDGKSNLVDDFGEYLHGMFP
ncbi:DNA ligase 6 isoform X1 [Tanacetum coccineum]